MSMIKKELKKHNMSMIKELVKNQTDKGLQEYLLAYHNFDFTNEGMLAMREEMIKELSAEIIKRRYKKLETLLNDPTETRDNELHTDQ